VALLRMPSDVWSGRPVVLVDDAAEDVATSDGLAADRCHRTGDRLGELKAAVWPRLVVVADVLGEHLVEVSPGDDEEMVELTGPNEWFNPLYELFLVSDGPFLGELDRGQAAN
jgi:hypothetical protein